MKEKHVSSFDRRNSDFRKLIILSLVIFAMIVQACHSPEANPSDPYEYLPTEMGRYQIYHVKEETYSAAEENPRIKSWYEKDQIIRKSKESGIGIVYVVSKSIRNSPTELWQKIREYTITSYPDKIIINQDNEILTQLIFPYNPTVTWKGYQYFNLDKDDPRAQDALFHYENLDQPLKIDSLKFDRTLKVSERSDTAFNVIYRLGFKQYALGVGLIAEEQTDFDYLQENGELVGYRIIESGTRKTRKIIEYGK